MNDLNISVTRLSNSEQYPNPASSQSGRQIKAMAANYFGLEERSLADWLEYMHGYAQHIHFYDSKTLTVQGSWQPALPQPEQIVKLEAYLRGTPVSDDILALAQQPQIALLLGFFVMHKKIQSQFNALSQRHQDDYFFQVLGFQPQPAVADKAHLVITLADDVPSLSLSEGLAFLGPDDENGEPLIYINQRNSVIHHAQLTKIQTLCVLTKSDDGSSTASPYQACLSLKQALDVQQKVEWPEDGLLSFGDKSFGDKSFGNKIAGDSSTENTDNDLSRYTSPELGFILARQELYLSGGSRTIHLLFVEKDGVVFDPDWFSIYFVLKLSTAEGMQGLNELSSATVNVIKVKRGIQLTIELTPLFPSIAPLGEELRRPGLPDLPFIQLSLKQNVAADQALLNHFSRGYFTAIELSTEVDGLEGVIVSNDAGRADGTKPFEPFGVAPRKGATLHFTHPELLVKNLNSAALNIRWAAKPENMLAHYLYYRFYQKKQEDRCDDYLYWFFSFSDSRQLSKNDETLLAGFDLDNESFNFSKVNQTFHLNKLPLDELDAKVWPQFFSLQLQNDLGHQIQSQTQQLMALEKNPVAISDKDVDVIKEGIHIVPDPYTPVIDRLSLSYTSTVTLTFENHASALFHKDPLGFPQANARSANAIALLPRVDKWGYLYLALENVHTPTQLSLYFQMEGVDGVNTDRRNEINWQYLDGQRWQSIAQGSVQGGFERGRIIQDSTHGLLDSGLVVFQLPRLDLKQHYLADGLLWLRLSITGNDDEQAKNAAKYSRIRQVYSQGIEVKLASNHHHASHYAQPLPAESIAELFDADAQIDTVSQPFSSYGGSQVESTGQLALRASERLRHKNRALTAWDIEHLVLQTFAQIYQVRTVQEWQVEGIVIKLVVVPVNHDVTVLQPKVPLYVKRQIQRFVEAHTMPGVTVEVVDPIYQELTVEASLKINDGFDIDRSIDILNQHIINYMTPWSASHQGGALQQRELYLSQLVMLFEREPAVQQLQYLQVRVLEDTDELFKNKFPSCCENNNKDEIKNIIRPTNSLAILVPAPQHSLSLVAGGQTDTMTGLGRWGVEDDFFVS